MDGNVFGIDPALLRNDNAVEILQAATNRLKARLDRKSHKHNVEALWSIPIKHIKDGQLTTEPFDPMAGKPYCSIAPIRIIFDTPPRNDVDQRIQQWATRAFTRYCDLADKHGHSIPKFNSRLTKFRFLLRYYLTRWGII
jgi:hypothetical protein